MLDIRRKEIEGIALSSRDSQYIYERPGNLEEGEMGMGNELHEHFVNSVKYGKKCFLSFRKQCAKKSIISLFQN